MQKITRPIGVTNKLSIYGHPSPALRSSGEHPLGGEDIFSIAKIPTLAAEYNTPPYRWGSYAPCKTRTVRNEVRETMQRRKFMIGAGSILAGASTVVGTGAITRSSMDRGVQGRVARDSNAYVAIKPSSNAGNEEHLKYDSSTGEMYLNFGNIGSGGAGLNPDSINQFDVVFTVENQNPSANDTHEYLVWFDSPSPRLNFYVDSQPGNYIESQADAAEHDPDDASPESGEWNPVPVGVEIDLRGSGLVAGDSLSSLFDTDDEFTLHMDKTNDPE